MDEYPSNSHKSKENNDISSIKIDPVVKAPAKTKKRSKLWKLADMFVPDDVKDIRSYIEEDVIVPAIKKGIQESVNAFLYGKGGAKSKDSSLSAHRVSYRSYYDEPERRSPVPSRGGYDMNDIIFEDRGDAEQVLDSLYDLLHRYKLVTVATLCELSNVKSTSEDYNYGWTDLSRAEVIRVYNGYTIRLPRPMPID